MITIYEIYIARYIICKKVTLISIFKHIFNKRIIQLKKQIAFFFYDYTLQSFWELAIKTLVQYINLGKLV